MLSNDSDSVKYDKGEVTLSFERVQPAASFHFMVLSLSVRYGVPLGRRESPSRSSSKRIKGEAACRTTGFYVRLK